MGHRAQVTSQSHDQPCRHSDQDAGLFAAAAAARAVAAWYSTETDRGDALTDVLLAMAFAARATRGNLGVRRPSEFLALLHAPLQSWLPITSDECLAEGERPSDYCLDMVAESGADPEAELVQARIGDARATFALRANGDAEYAAFRQFLIEHGYCRNTDAMKAIAPSGLALADLYEEIPRSCRFGRPDRERCWPCPVCGWPMRVEQSLVECSSPTCRTEGARYRANQVGSLTPLGRYAAPAALPVDVGIRLRRGVWRYTLLPGLAELDLAGRLRKVRGVNVVMWPQRDRYDLHVEAAGHTWRVDVKDWSNPVALASHLSRVPPEHETFLVVPDRRKYQLPILRERVTQRDWSFASVSEIIGLVGSARDRAKGES